MQVFVRAITLAFLIFWGDSATGTTLNVSLADSPVSLDWNGLSTMVEAPIILNIHEGLFGYDPMSGKLIPAIAESVTKSADLTEYTFKIRKDAKWSDGRSVHADDFVNAWMRLLSPQSGSIYIYYLYDILNAKEYNRKEIPDSSQIGIVAPDDHTLKVRLKRPHAEWERNTAFWPLFPIRKDQIEKYGANWWRPGILISCGPFVLESYEAGKSVVLKRNPNHSLIKSDIDTIDFRISSNRDDVIKKFNAGFFQLIWGFPPESLRKNVIQAKIGNLDILRGHLLALNTAKFPMNNREFRLGFLKAIQTQSLLPKDASQLIPVNTFIPEPLLGSNGITRLDYNPKEAKEHLRKSGVLKNSKLKIRVLTNLSEPFFSVGRNLQNEIQKNLGLTVELAAYHSKDYTTYMNLGDYDATLITWTAKVLSPQDFLLPYSREAVYNRMNYSSATFEKMIFDGVSAKNSELSNSKFLEAQRILAIEDATASPLFRERAAFATHESIKKVYFNHMGIPLLKEATH